MIKIPKRDQVVYPNLSRRRHGKRVNKESIASYFIIAREMLITQSNSGLKE